MIWFLSSLPRLVPFRSQRAGAQRDAYADQRQAAGDAAESAQHGADPLAHLQAQHRQPGPGDGEDDHRDGQRHPVGAQGEADEQAIDAERDRRQPG
jgi:hypothetical protein